MMKSVSRFFRDGHGSKCPFLLLIIGSIVCTLIVLGLYFLRTSNVVEIIFNGDVVQTFPVELESEMYIDYTHSVAKTNVRDVFVIKEDNSLVLTRTEYESFGAGLPTENYGSFEHIHGKYINSGINVTFDEVPLRVGIIANHRLTFQDGRGVVFSDLIEAGNLVIVKPNKVSRLKVLFIKGGMKIGQNE